MRDHEMRPDVDLDRWIDDGGSSHHIEESQVSEKAMTSHIRLIEVHGNTGDLTITAKNTAKKLEPGCTILGVRPSGQRCDHGAVVWAVEIQGPKPTRQTPETEKHDYEPGTERHPMQTDPSCRICGRPKNDKIVHR